MISKVTEWLDEQGFALEMHTAEAFRSVGFEVRQATHYVDAESGKGRELDVLAIDPDVLGVLDIAFIVECKASKKPWALLCSPDTLTNYNRLFAFAVLSPDARGAVADRFAELIDRWPWLRKEAMAAYSVRQAFSESDAAYAAAMVVAKASTLRVEGDSAEPKAPYIFAFPVIVVDSPLIACSLSEGAGISAVEIEEGEWLFVAQVPQYFGTCIRIVSRKRLPQFVKEARAFALAVREELKGEVERVVESWRTGGRTGA